MMTSEPNRYPEDLAAPDLQRIIDATGLRLAEGISQEHLARAILKRTGYANRVQTLDQIPTPNTRRETMKRIASRARKLMEAMAVLVEGEHGVEITVLATTKYDLDRGDRDTLINDLINESVLRGEDLDDLPERMPLEVGRFLEQLHLVMCAANHVSTKIDDNPFLQKKEGLRPETLLRGRWLPAVFAECFGRPYGNGSPKDGKLVGPGQRFVSAVLEVFEIPATPDSIHQDRKKCLKDDRATAAEYPK